MASKDSLVPFAIQCAFHKFNLCRAVTFHSTNKRAKLFAQQAGEVLQGSNIDVFRIDGTMPVKKRGEIMSNATLSPKSIIANCQLLITGVDIPSLELVVIADPVKSHVIAQQIIGRVSRKSPGKERGYVLVPLLSMEKDFVQSTEFHTFVEIFCAIMKSDPELKKDIIFINKRRKTLGRPLQVEDFPPVLRKVFHLPSSMPLEMQLEVMSRVIVEALDRDQPNRNPWDEMYDLLEKYKDRKGNCSVPFNHKEEGHNLGNWLNTQRQLKKNGKLDVSTINRLESLGVFWDVFDEKWENMFRLMEQYKEQHGDYNVPFKHKEDGFNIGQWLNKQRHFKKKDQLEASRRDRLDKLGVVWKVNESPKLWENVFQLLKQYKQREGNCNVLQNHKEDNFNLGYWLNTQRKLKKKGTLEDSRKEELERLGVVWNPSDEQWEQMFCLFREYKQRNGDCNVPRSYSEDGANLGRWLSFQRELKKKGKMDASREERLEKLGVVWEPRKK